MQHKQVPRIALEIFDTPDTPLDIRLAVLRFLANSRSFPKLGPYRKRSPEQALWRIASNAQLGWAERWEALRHLLQMMATTAPVADGKDAVQATRNPVHSRTDTNEVTSC
jgi:hypothetical protein